MIRNCTDEDISDEELEKVINPFYDNYHEYIITYVMPEIIAYYIANAFNRNSMYSVHLINIIILLKVCLIYLMKITKLFRQKYLNY